ncbi:MAG: hypothetical protein GF411_00445, partial [Candidatus Lokiarchaeota archaeon]|nr:hypothetical protein [Candidatus Lokiarchaeota archaeon]
MKKILIALIMTIFVINANAGWLVGSGSTDIDIWNVKVVDYQPSIGQITFRVDQRPNVMLVYNFTNNDLASISNAKAIYSTLLVSLNDSSKKIRVLADGIANDYLPASGVF